MKRWALSVLTFFYVQLAFAQKDILRPLNDSINQRIFLICDAGDMNS